LLATTSLSVPGASASQVLDAKIAYLHNGDIYLFDVSSRQTKQLTIRGDIANLSWSPDGQHIAFETNGGASSDIYSMNADGTAITPIAVTADDEMTPDYSSSDTIYYVKRI